MDARDCFRDIVSAKKTEINKDLKSEEKFFDHIYMNLPGDAIEFLDIFYGFLKFADLNSWNKDNLPLIHVYSFCESDEEKSNNILMERIRKKLPNFKNENVTCFHTIKDVSTFKKMFGISFKLSVEDALGLGVENSNDLGENPSKKIKI